MTDPNDAACLRALAGARIAPGARVTLPSGKVMGTAQTAQEQPTSTPKPTSVKFRKAVIGEYIGWLKKYIQRNEPTHFYEYPWERARFIYALNDFTTGGECGAYAYSIIVPKGVRYIGGPFGHNNIFTFNPLGNNTGVVPIYNDPEFAKLGWKVTDFIAVERDKQRTVQMQYDRMLNHRTVSDVSDYKEATR